MCFSFKILNAYLVMYGMAVSVNGACNTDFAFIAAAEYILTVFCNGFVPYGIFIEIIHTVWLIYVVDKRIRNLHASHRRRFLRQCCAHLL